MLRTLLLASSLAVVVALGSTPIAAQKSIQSVLVTNDQSHPVPTTATNPLNGQNNPVPLATLEAFQPYEDSCFVAFNGRQGSCSFLTLPSGKRLVIQEFDASGFMDPGVKPLTIAIKAGPVIDHYFPATFMGTADQFPPLDLFATHQETHLYVPVNSAASCTVQLSAVASIESYTCALSGFLVDVP